MLQIILKLCHPIIPYITEEIWSEITNRGFADESMLINSKFPSQQKIFHDSDLLHEISIMKDIVNNIRKTRSDLNIHPKNKLQIIISCKDALLQKDIHKNDFLIKKLANVSEITIKDESVPEKHHITITMKNIKIFLSSKEAIDVGSEILRLSKKLELLEEGLNKIDHKLKNKNFIEKAPSEIIKENTLKRENIVTEIKTITELIGRLSN